MPSKLSDPRKRLFHIRDQIHLARTFIAGLDYEAFRDNQLVFYAVTRALEIISEASRRLPADMKARHPNIPWTEMAAAGNVYRPITRTCSSASCGAPCTIALRPC
jgi:uncharacterized protein with HEPN domain